MLRGAGSHLSHTGWPDRDSSLEGTNLKAVAGLSFPSKGWLSALIACCFCSVIANKLSVLEVFVIGNLQMT